MLNHLDSGVGQIAAARLSIDDLLGWAQCRADEGAGPYTVNMELGKLGTVLRYAGAVRRLALSDVVGQVRPLLAHAGLIGGGGKRARRVNEDELLRILGELQQPYRDAVLFAVLSTLRRSELCRIRWADVDAENRLILVRDRKHPRKKIGNDERIPLRSDA